MNQTRSRLVVLLCSCFLFSWLSALSLDEALNHFGAESSETAELHFQRAEGCQSGDCFIGFSRTNPLSLNHYTQGCRDNDRICYIKMYSADKARCVVFELKPQEGAVWELISQEQNAAPWATNLYRYPEPSLQDKIKKALPYITVGVLACGGLSYLGYKLVCKKDEPQVQEPELPEEFFAAQP